MKIPVVVKNHRKKFIGGTIAVILILLLGWSFAGGAEPEFVTAQAEVTDIVQTVEAVGTVISERDLQLQFPLSGVVAQVFVKEGDRVRPGQRLAQLKSGSRSATISGQVAALQYAEASLRLLLEGTRPEEIAISEAEVENRRAALAAARSALITAEASLRNSNEKLQALKSEASVSLSGEVAIASTTLSTQLLSAENSLTVIDDVFNALTVQDAVIRDNPGAYSSVKMQRNTAQASISTARTKSASAVDYQSALVALELARSALNMTANALNTSFDLLTATPEIGSYTAAEREMQRSKIIAARDSAQAALSAINSAVTGIRNASAGFETRLVSEQAAITSAEGEKRRAESEILSNESLLRTQEAQLALKRAGPRKADIDATQARVRQARADLARTQADFSDTVLVSPIDGQVTNVHVKVGEYTPAGAAITLLGTSPYRVEMFVSEIDVPELLFTQTGSVELDAFPGVQYKVRVGEISQAPTDVDGIAKYRVKLDFMYPHDEFRVGMTGDVTVIIAEQRNVLTVPGRAVIESGSGDTIVRVLEGKTVREAPVIVGMEGEAGDIEILTGLSAGDTVILLER